MSVTSIADRTTSAQVPFTPALEAAEQNNLQALCLSLFTLLAQQQAQITRLQTALQHSEAEKRKLREYKQTVQDLMPIPSAVLRPVEKLTYLQHLDWMERASHRDPQGRVRTVAETAAQHLGISASAAGDSYRRLRDVGLMDGGKQSEFEEGQIKTYTYYKPQPQQIAILRQRAKEDEPAKRQWGGKRVTCPGCGSENVIIETVITCRDCGHQHRKRHADQATTNGGQDDSHENAERESQDASLYKPVIPCEGQDDRHATVPFAVAPVVEPTARAAVATTLATMRQAAALLVEVAGPTKEHLVMLPDGPAKYCTEHQPLVESNAFRHLQGGRAQGAALRYPEGKTRALAWDADDAAGYQSLQEAAQKLAAAGYLPILEPSPATDHHAAGGHLWIIFDALVDAQAAFAHCFQFAPELETFSERWPQGKKMVRLPGGRYVRPGVNAWCELVSVADGETSHNGEEAARLLLSHQTPAPEFPPCDRNLEEATPKPSDQPVLPAICTPGEVDETWRAKYGEEEQHFLVKFSCRDLIERFNRMHDLESIHPREPGSSYALAIWRGERDGSVQYNDDGTWHDYGNHGDYPNHGDALDLFVLVSRVPSSANFRAAKTEVLRDLGRAAHQEAIAARADNVPTQRLTPAQGRLPGLNALIVANAARQGEPDGQVEAPKTAQAVPTPSQLREAKATILAWSAAHDWQAIIQNGKTYGGDQRAWQMGVSLEWYAPQEICQLAALVG